jgi:hypothetical protein
MLRAFGALSLLLAACTSPAGEETQEPGSEASNEDDLVKAGGAPSMCVAVRGNGHYIVTHFASLARVVEHYGVPNGMAGGSSGSITQFLYESILMNPVVRKCGERNCTPSEASARVALTLKSLEGYGEAVAGSDEVVSIQQLVGLVSKLKAKVDEKGIPALVDSDSTLAAQKLREVLSIPEFAEIVNPEIMQLLSDPARAGFAAKDVQTSITTLGAFSVDDNRLFFRPGLLNWNQLANLFGRVANFYAGYGPADVGALQSWLDDCATPTLGLPWTEASQVDSAGGKCGARFLGMVAQYREQVRKSPPTKNRLDERVDAATPLAKMISTAVLEGDAVTAYKKARTEYLGGKYPKGDIAFAPNFDDIKFGYWGRSADLTKVAKNAKGYDDLKTKKFSALGGGPWREVLTASPAEPGLSRFVELPDGRVSAGGWSDLAPVLVLKNMGCKTVVYVTRQGDESGFASKIAKRVSMNEESWGKLFDLRAESGYTKSVREADGVWCTNWNAFGDLQQREMSLESYGALLETRPSFSARRPLRAYANVTGKSDKPGCTPLVSGGAVFPVD